jgi:N-acetylneuraminic acid mutarotase
MQSKTHTSEPGIEQLMKGLMREFGDRFTQGAVDSGRICGEAADAERNSGWFRRGLLSGLSGFVCLLLVLATPSGLWGQAAEWTWVGGSKNPSADGVYGMLGQASATNQPGARQGSPVWRDANGNLWMFGGNGYDSTHQLGAAGSLNDLWMYNISTNEWTWEAGSSSFPSAGSGQCPSGVFGVKGTAASGNTPGGNFGGQSWTDKNGNLWLFSGSQCDSAGHAGTLNDLWMFSPTTNEWTWIAGIDVNGATTNVLGIYGTLGTASATNSPGSRQQGATWTDPTGKLWLFGGEGTDSVTAAPLPLNDLWRFDPATKEWTWENGPNTVIVTGTTAGNPGIYEQQGALNPNNQPGGRDQAATWLDANGNLWMFGGLGDDSTGTASLSLNDLWMYSTSVGEWIWVGGPATVTHKFGMPGVYGTLGTAAASNWPGGRYGSSAWVDAAGNFWLFGGDGYDVNGSAGFLGDVWKYNPSSGEWTWVAGSNTVNPAAVYPTLGTTSAANIPPARELALDWTDKQGNFWLFGGRGSFDSQNDLWRFNSPEAVMQTAATPVISLATGTYTSAQTVTITDSTAGATIYYTTNGTTPTANSTQYMGAITVSSTETVEAIAVATGYTNSGVASATYTINIPVAATPMIAPAGGTYTSAQSVTITDSTAGATIYYTTNGTTPTASSSVYSGAISVGSTETVEAIAVATGFTNSAVASATYTINIPTAAAPIFSPAQGTYTSVQSVTIMDSTAGATIYYTTNGTTPTAASTKYTGAISVGSTETIEAIAVAAGFNNSIVSSATYTINLPAAATPVIAPAAGTYTSAQSVTITDATAGATIYYTTDGTMPTASSTVYSGAITVSSSETVEAIALAGGFANSAVASAAYVVNIVPPGFTLGANPSSLTIKSGSSGTTVITVTPTGGFTGTVNFTCGTLPTDVTCNFSPASVTVAAGGAAPTTTLTVGTTGTASAALSGAPNGGLLPEIFVAMILLPMGLTRRILRMRKAGGSWLMGLLLVGMGSVALAGMVGLAGCGGSGNKSTPAGNYTVPVDVTSGGISVPLNLSVTVD